MLSVELIRDTLQRHKVWVDNHNLNPNEIGVFRKLLPLDSDEHDLIGVYQLLPIHFDLSMLPVGDDLTLRHKF